MKASQHDGMSTVLQAVQQTLLPVPGLQKPSRTSAALRGEARFCERKAAKGLGGAWKERGSHPQESSEHPLAPLCPCRARRGRLLLLLRLCRHFPAGALHPSLPAGGSTRSRAAGPARALRLGQPAMASLAAQDSYLQGLARRAGVQHSPESRKRKFGTANGTLRFWFVGGWA